MRLINETYLKKEELAARLLQLIGAIPTVAHIVSRTRGNPPVTSEQVTIDAAMAIIKSSATPATMKIYADELERTTFRMVNVDTGKDYVARQAPFTMSANIIWLPRLSLKLQPKFLAAVLLHESVHLKNGQFNKSESQAYQVQSDYLRALGIEGDMTHLNDTICNGDQDTLFVSNMADQFERHHVNNPAITGNRQ